MTDEQKFLFDIRGWLLLPAVLNPQECEAIRDHIRSGGNGFTGPAQALLDHPAIVPILNAILSEWGEAEDHYNFRCENSFITVRQAGWKLGSTDVPHVVRPPQHAGAMRYQADGGRIYSALTRVVWELNPVERGDGGTLFLLGSHKARIAYPESVLKPDNPHMESYGCPAGSAFIFTESLLHAATAWKNPEVERISIFNCYNSVWAQWHRLNLPHDLIESMPTKRRTLFRGVYAHDFHMNAPNHLYAADNRSL